MISVEIVKPGGFLLMLLNRLEDTTLGNIESKILELEENGIITYDFVPSGFGECVAMEIYEDLRVFVETGWIKFVDDEYKLTPHGKSNVEEFEIPQIAKEAFEKLFETGIGTFTVKKLCGICEHHGTLHGTCQKGHGAVPYDFDFLKIWGKPCEKWELKKCLIPDDN